MTFTQPPAPAIAPKNSGIAVAALVVGIGAFVLGLVPVLGILLALTGIVIGIIALRKPGRKTLPAIGLVLSGIATITGIVAIILTFTLLPTLIEQANERVDGAAPGVESSQPDAATDSGQLLLTSTSTPCYTFDAPREFINNQSSADGDLCVTTRQGWGEMDADGTITYTGVGAIWDQVLVEPIRVETTDTMAPDGELDTMIDYLEVNYFPQLGEVISLREPIMLDGEEANLTRVDSTAETTVTKATLVVKSPEPYDTANGPVHFFLITFVIDDERGDVIIDALVDSWRWQ